MKRGFLKTFFIVLCVCIVAFSSFAQDFTYDFFFPPQSLRATAGLYRVISPRTTETFSFHLGTYLGFFDTALVTDGFLSFMYPLQRGRPLVILPEQWEERDERFVEWRAWGFYNRVNLTAGIFRRKVAGFFGVDLALSVRNTSVRVEGREYGRPPVVDTPQALGDIFIIPKFSYTFDQGDISTALLFEIGLYSLVRSPRPGGWSFSPNFSAMFDAGYNNFLRNNRLEWVRWISRYLHPKFYFNFGFTWDNSWDALGDFKEPGTLPDYIRSLLFVWPRNHLNIGMGLEVGNSLVGITRFFSISLEWYSMIWTPQPEGVGFGFNPHWITFLVRGKPLQGFFVSGGIDFNISGVTVQPGGWVSRVAPPVTFFLGANIIWNPAEVRIEHEEKPKYGKVRGIVIDEETGAPIGEAIVIYVGTGLTNQSTDPRTGSFISYDLPEGYVEIQVRKEGYEIATKRVKVEADKVVNVTIPLRKIRITGVLEGIVKDTKGTPVPAKIEVEGADIPPVFADNAGRYEITLEPGIYTVKFSAYGYKDFETQVEIIPESRTTLNVTLEPIEKEEVFVFEEEKPKEVKIRRVFIEKVQKKILLAEKILFEPGTDNILPVSYDILKELADFLKENKNIKKIRIEVHTDPVGTPEEDLELTERRAQRIKEFLVKEGVEPERIETKGFGSTRPIASNDTPEGRARNRRVEIKILEME